MKLLEGALSVSVGVDVAEDPAAHLRVVQSLLQDDLGDRMMSPVHVLKESVYLGIVQPFFFVVLKAASRWHAHGEQSMQHERINCSRRRQQSHREENRQEGRRGPATSSNVQSHSQAKAGSAPENVCQVPIGLIFCNAERNLPNILIIRRMQPKVLKSPKWDQKLLLRGVFSQHYLYGMSRPSMPSAPAASCPEQL